MKIAIDFDGVICKWNGILRGHNFNNCPPQENAVEAVTWLIGKGHEVWIFTARPETEWENIASWCNRWGIPVLEITNIKRDATMTLDDRAVRFTNWQDFCKLIE